MGRQLAERAQALQASINDAGFGPASPSGHHCLSAAWKAAAKAYRRQARQLSIAPDRGQANSDMVFEQLKAERDQARKYAGDLETVHSQALRRAAAAEQSVTTLRRALVEYGDHSRQCATRRSPGGLCNCGFSQALEIGKGGGPAR
jgi:hypothetical protein